MRSRMCLADWYAWIESVPLTDNQLGRIAAECERLGLDDRAERLAITAALAGLDGIDSTRDLTQGQAGRVIRVLTGTRHRAELDAMLPAPEPVTPQYPPVPDVTWADVFAALAAFIKAIDPGQPHAAAATSPAPE